MTERPFDLSKLKLTLPGQEAHPQAGGRQLDTEFDRIISLDNKYHYSEGDTEKGHETRNRLLEGVSVTDQGIAVCTTDSTTTRLVAFRVANHRAKHIPFTHGENNEVLLPLPAETGSQIGFFIEDASRDTSSSASLRQGEYPGIPLTSRPFEKIGIDTKTPITVDGERSAMIAIMEGLQDPDAQMWAHDIKLSTSLGFNRERTRELLGMRYVEDSKNGEDTITNRRLLVLPEHMRDLADHYDAMDVTRDVFQILTFENTAPITRPTVNIAINPHMFENPLGIGLSTPFTTKEQPTSRTDGIGEMQSAFQIRVVPQAK